MVDNINDYMIGEKMLTKEDLLKFISDVVNNKDDYKEQRHKFAQKMFKYKKRLKYQPFFCLFFYIKFM